MAFKMKGSPMKRNFGVSPLKQATTPIGPIESEDDIITGKFSKQDEEIDMWDKETSEGNIDVSKGTDWLAQDLESVGYQKRLEKELKRAKNNQIKVAPTKEEIAIKPQKSISTIYNPTKEQILTTRKNRLDNIIWNKPSTHTKEGSEIGYAVHDAIIKGEKTGETSNTARLMPNSNVYFSSDMDWEDEQKNRIESGDLVIHEGTHGVTAGEYGMLPSTVKLLSDAKGGEGELALGQEVYARYKVTQKFLQEQGIFNAFSGEEFTNKHVKLVNELMKGVNKDNFQEKGIPYEVFTFLGNDQQHPHGFNKKISKKDMKTIFNEVAFNEGKNIEGINQNPYEVTDDWGVTGNIT